MNDKQAEDAGIAVLVIIALVLTFVVVIGGCAITWNLTSALADWLRAAH